jgi:hypothetical protein
MAYVKLLPPEGRDPLPAAEVIRRLRDEFAVVDADPDAGQDHVADLIVATLRLSATLPGGEERVAALRAAQQEAVYLIFGDDLRLTAECCVQPGWPLFFGRRDAMNGPARPLVERAAAALGYVVDEG